MRIWLQSSTKPEVRYEVLSFNPVTHRAILRGKLGEYDSPLWPYICKRAGIKLIVENDDAKLT